MTRLIDELVGLVSEFAERLGSLESVSRASMITREGTSSDRQRAVRDAALADGASDHEALIAVVDHLIDETMEGV